MAESSTSSSLPAHNHNSNNNNNTTPFKFKLSLKSIELADEETEEDELINKTLPARLEANTIPNNNFGELPVPDDVVITNKRKRSYTKKLTPIVKKSLELETFFWVQCESSSCSKWRKICTEIFLSKQKQITNNSIVYLQAQKEAEQNNGNNLPKKNRHSAVNSKGFPLAFELSLGPLTSYYPITQEQWLTQPFHCWDNPDPARATCDIPQDQMQQGETVIAT
jgi:hypothetical protein